MRAIRSAVIAFLAAWAAFGQARPQFEVATVKSAQPSPEGRLMVRMGGDPGMIRMSNVSLRDLIRTAYEVKDYQITGPDWINRERYDVMAKIPPGTPKDQVLIMRQSLLADRFKLQLHHDQKELPVYALVVGKGGMKIQPVEEQTDGDNRRPGGMMRMMGLGHIEVEKISLAQFAEMISRFADRPIVDNTGVKGLFNFKLDFAIDPGVMMQMKMAMRDAGPGGPRPEGAGEKPSDPMDLPSIFSAVQDRLGLKLEGRKEPVDILVIDHAEKAPIEN
jgi:uncharacterized protein (TIGR03435 family)